MAERRMFAKTIIDSDAFLDMPLTSQALYFHLSMRADDEGFINNPKKIQRMINATDDDMKLLATKNFIIPFESGIVVIKHWRIHNYIRADRLNETKYKEERNLLSVKPNGAYTFNEELKIIEKMDATDRRKLAYKNSSLPYSFTYKIKRAFEGSICPVCGIKMTSAYKTSMPTIQHNIPISKGGLHELENISVICESCNTSIKDTETGCLNNKEVIEKWDKIIIAEKNKVDWFSNPQLLCQANDSQMSVKCPSSGSIGKVRLGKNSINNNVHSKEVDDLFESLWKLYIRKEGKSAVTKKAKEEIYTIGFDRMEKCIKKYAQLKQGCDKQYILMGSTFFNGRYKDYLEEPAIEEPEQVTEEHELTDEEWVELVKNEGLV